MTTSNTRKLVQTLQGQLAGYVLQPNDPDYDKFRRGFNLAIDQHPALILVADNAQDVVAGVRYAHEHHLGVSVLLTGHGVQHPADDNLLIVTSCLTAVQVDAAKRTARVEAGARYKDVLDQSVKHGLAPLMGTSPHVGVVGYTVGGGIGWLSRKYGFAADSVRWIEVVTADGQLRHTSATEHADLFWALRGGGGNFGVVTAMQFSLYPMMTVYGGSLTYPAETAGDALGFYRDWTRQLPDEMTASIAIVKYPDIPQMPEALRGKTQVILRAAYDGTAKLGEALLQPWLDWQEPMGNTFHEMSFGDIGSIQNDPVDPVNSYASNEMFNELSDAAIEVIVRYATDKESPLLYSELRQGGGAMAHRDSAIGNRDASFYFLVGGITPNEQAREAVKAYIKRYKDDLKPSIQGGVYLNFLRGDEARNRTLDAYGAEIYKRLVAVKAEYDPTNMFRYSYQLVSGDVG